MKMDLALNYQQSLICHKKLNQTIYQSIYLLGCLEISYILLESVKKQMHVKILFTNNHKNNHL